MRVFVFQGAFCLTLMKGAFADMSAATILEKEAAVKRRDRRELILLGFVSVLIFSAVLFCAGVVASKELASDEGKLAFGLLTVIVSSLLSYVAGKSSK